jgi:hypothetical protein
MVFCEGCYQNFKSAPDLARHVALSRNPDCIAVRSQQLRAGHHNSSDQDMVFDSPGDLSSAPDVPMLFEGDFFGNDYGEEDFPGWDEDEDLPDLGDVSSDSDSSDEELTADGWEPIAHSISQPQEEDPASPPGQLEDETSASSTCRHHTKDQLWKPPVRVLYPGKHAGEIIRQESSVRSKAENPFSPFRHEMDWEVAQWTKMSGISATALTKLLKIPNVRTLVPHVVSI